MGITAHPSRLRTSGPDYVIMAAVGVLVVMGVVAVHSSSFALGLLEFGDANYFPAASGDVRDRRWCGDVGADEERLPPATRDQSVADARARCSAWRLCWCRASDSESNGATRWIRHRRADSAASAERIRKLALIIYVSAWLAGRGDNVKDF
jgi:cell division protein FtsW (lipid II flippase)